MNKITFLYKFYFNKQHRGNYNWNLLFPFAGVIIGCMTVALTLAIMEGMEYAIFTKLENISLPGKITNNIGPQGGELEKYLQHNNIYYQKI